MAHFPPAFDVGGSEYVHFRSYVELLATSQYINAVTAFLSWFKFIAYLSLGEYSD
jgi:hypothetical protein